MAAVKAGWGRREGEKGAARPGSYLRGGGGALRPELSGTPSARAAAARPYRRRHHRSRGARWEL